MKNYKLSSRISNFTESSIRNSNPSIVKNSCQDLGDPCKQSFDQRKFENYGEYKPKADIEMNSNKDKENLLYPIDEKLEKKDSDS